MATPPRMNQRCHRDPGEYGGARAPPGADQRRGERPRGTGGRGRQDGEGQANVAGGSPGGTGPEAGPCCPCKRESRVRWCHYPGPGKGGKVIFAHDTEVALASTAALVNTGRGGKELLPGLDALDQFVADWGWTGGRAHDQAELDGVRRLRPRLEPLWEMDVDAAAGL